MQGFPRIMLLLAALVTIVGCLRIDEARESPETTATQQEPIEIVFRGRYFMSKECRPGPKGELALGLHPVCEVLEVLQGQLKLQRLMDIDLPKDVQEGETYTFRWKLSGSTQQELRKAEAGGYTGMWLGGERLEFAGPTPKQ